MSKRKGALHAKQIRCYFLPLVKNKTNHHEQKAVKGFPCLHEPCFSPQTHLMPSSLLTAHCAPVTLSFLQSFKHAIMRGLHLLQYSVILLHSFITYVTLPLESLFSLICQDFLDNFIWNALLLTWEPINLFHFLYSTHPYLNLLTQL